MIRFSLFLVGSFLCAPATFAQMRLPTVDEALELSAKTGRPVFAMAGQKT
jgi:hypothetical protein